MIGDNSGVCGMCGRAFCPYHAPLYSHLQIHNYNPSYHQSQIQRLLETQLQSELSSSKSKHHYSNDVLFTRLGLGFVCRYCALIPDGPRIAFIRQYRAFVRLKAYKQRCLEREMGINVKSLRQRDDDCYNADCNKRPGLCNFESEEQTWPKLGDTRIDLFALYSEVLARGGAENITDEGWISIARELGVPASMFDLPYLLHIIYYGHLNSFQRFLYDNRITNNTHKLSNKNTYYDNVSNVGNIIHSVDSYPHSNSTSSKCDVTVLNDYDDKIKVEVNVNGVNCEGMLLKIQTKNNKDA